MKKSLLTLALLSLSTLTFADGVLFKNVNVNRGEGGALTVTATLSHANESFSHFVKFVKVYSTNGDLLGKVDFPFARSSDQPIEAIIKNINAPSDAKSLVVNAYTSAVGDVEASVEVDIQ